MPRISKRLVDGLTTTGADYWVWDDLVPGFGIRVRASGDRSYVYQWRDRKARRVKLATVGQVTPEQARELARKAAAAVANGQDPAQERSEKRKALTVAEVVAKFLAEYAAQKKPATKRNYELISRLHVVPALGRIVMRDMKRPNVARMLSDLRGTPYMANRVRAFVSKLAEWARLHGHYPEDAPNPVRGIPAEKEVKREAQMTVDELARLSAALAKAEKNPAFASAARVIRALLLTGARVSEMQNLKWSQVRTEEDRVHLDDSKTGQRDVILGDAARKFFEGLDQPEVGDGFVFPSPAKEGIPVGEIRAVWYELRKAAELPNTLRVHDLRHVHASLAVSAGLSLYVTGRLLGHKQASTTQRYAHIADAAAKEAADKVSGIIAAAMATKPRARVVPMARTVEPAP